MVLTGQALPTSAWRERDELRTLCMTSSRRRGAADRRRSTQNSRAPTTEPPPAPTRLTELGRSVKDTALLLEPDCMSLMRRGTFSARQHRTRKRRAAKKYNILGPLPAAGPGPDGLTTYARTP